MARFGTTVFPRIRIGIGAGRYLYLPVLTSTQRSALSASAGFLVYNSTTTQVECYNGSSWVAVGKLYGDATFLPLAGGTMSGNIAMAGAQTVDGVDISAHAADLAAHTKSPWEILRTGAYYPFTIGRPYSSQALTADILYGMPIIVPRNITVDRIAVEVTAQAGQAIRLGIYQNGTNLYPGAKLLDAGAVTLSGTGIVAITINQALTKGIYHLVIVTNGTPTIAAFDNQFMALQSLGLFDTSFQYAFENWKVAFTYAALPDPFTAGGAIDNTTHRPTIALRVASLD